MRIVRFAILKLLGEVSLDHNGAQVGDVNIRLSKVDSLMDRECRYLPISKINLPAPPPLDEEQRLLIDPSMREACEFAIG